jgi:hypothetical protein
MPSGVNALEISDIKQEITDAGLTGPLRCNKCYIALKPPKGVFADRAVCPAGVRPHDQRANLQVLPSARLAASTNNLFNKTLDSAQSQALGQKTNAVGYSAWVVDIVSSFVPP